MSIFGLFICSWWAQILFLGWFTTSSHAYHKHSAVATSTPTPRLESTGRPYNYELFGEVQEACRSILSEGSELEIGYDPRNSLEIIWWSKAEWRKSSSRRSPPSILFDEAVGGGEEDAIIRSFFLKLTDVDHTNNRSQSAVNVSGTLYLSAFGYVTYYNSTLPLPQPHDSSYIYKEMDASLDISMKGIYTETNVVDGGAHRVLCMLGKMSSSSYFHFDPNNMLPPSFSPDDKLLLVLRYPKTFTLTARAVYGELTSLGQPTDHNFFDRLVLTSQLNPETATYQFGAADNLVNKACTPYPYPDKTFAQVVPRIYKGTGFCQLLNHFFEGDFIVVPNWDCNSSDWCRKMMGPFQDVSGLVMVMKDVRCESNISSAGEGSAKVSAYFRIFPNSMYNSRERVDLDDTTLSVQGKWDSATGQLCMVGCTGYGGGESCKFRVSLYILSSFSISQRNVISGSISTFDEYLGLSFKKPVSTWQLNNLRKRRLSYEYTKVSHAVSLLERSGPLGFGTRIKRAALKYPRVEYFTDDYSFYACSRKCNCSPEDPESPDYLRIISINGFVRYQRWEKSAYWERQLLLNISANLELREESYRNISMLSMEGIYVPVHGKLFLIACRDVLASREIFSESKDLENGMDCLIEVKIEFQPMTTRCRLDQIAEVSIRSQRREGDPLYFAPIKFHTYPIIFESQPLRVENSSEGNFTTFPLLSSVL